MDYSGYGYGYNYNPNTMISATNTIAVVFLVIMCIVGLIVLAISIFQIIGTWKIFKKAGQPGWAALIPIYNMYILCKVTGVNPYWVLILALSGLLSFIPIIGSLAIAIVTIYATILIYVSLANSFGKDTGWVIGLVLLNPFFMFALGIGSSTYLGPKPMNDFVFNGNSKEEPSNSEVKVESVEVKNEEPVKEKVEEIKKEESTETKEN